MNNVHNNLSSDKLLIQEQKNIVYRDLLTGKIKAENAVNKLCDLNFELQIIDEKIADFITTLSELNTAMYVSLEDKDIELSVMSVSLGYLLDSFNMVVDTIGSKKLN